MKGVKMGEVKLIFFILNPQNETLPPSLCFFPSKCSKNIFLQRGGNSSIVLKSHR